MYVNEKSQWTPRQSNPRYWGFIVVPRPTAPPRTFVSPYTRLHSTKARKFREGLLPISLLTRKEKKRTATSDRRSVRIWNRPVPSESQGVYQHLSTFPFAGAFKIRKEIHCNPSDHFLSAFQPKFCVHLCLPLPPPPSPPPFSLKL